MPRKSAPRKPQGEPGRSRGPVTPRQNLVKAKNAIRKPESHRRAEWERRLTARRQAGPAAAAIPAETKSGQGKPALDLEATDWIAGKADGHLAGIRWQLGRLRQAELAALLGVHPVTVSLWESGSHVPSPWQVRLLNTLRAAAGCPPAYSWQRGYYSAREERAAAFAAAAIPQRLAELLCLGLQFWPRSISTQPRDPNQPVPQPRTPASAADDVKGKPTVATYPDGTKVTVHAFDKPQCVKCGASAMRGIAWALKHNWRMQEGGPWTCGTCRAKAAKGGPQE